MGAAPAARACIGMYAMLAASIIFAVQAQGLDWKTRNETALASDLRERLRPSRSVPPPGKASVDVQFSLWRIVEVNTRTQTITVQGWW